mmetsp:Transcript_15425/g.23728  ORF Transcript_15425/g.23728 Transcript_15425/m.23728 type:complete len:190 (-) Transcript_15425:20-589(-)
MIYTVCKEEEPDLEFSKIFAGHMSHFLVECSSKPIDLTDRDDPANGGAVCMPYYGYDGEQSKGSLIKYNGPNENGHWDAGQDKIWNDTQQCLAADCKTLASVAECEAGSVSTPCVCYNTCPTGPTYYPLFDDWDSTTDVDQEATYTKHWYLYAHLVQKPCSGKGACRHDGTCVCVPGYSGDNCSEHSPS